MSEVYKIQVNDSEPIEVSQQVYEVSFCFNEMLKEKDKEIERLNNIINKAIDFLKENACIDEDVEYFCDDLRYDDCKKLLDILKGGSKECVKKKQDYI